MHTYLYIHSFYSLVRCPYQPPHGELEREPDKQRAQHRSGWLPWGSEGASYARREHKVAYHNNNVIMMYVKLTVFS